jgi:hypothetical protein
MADPQASAASLSVSHRVAPTLTLPEGYHLDQSAENDKEQPPSAAADRVEASDILQPPSETDARRGPSLWRRAIIFAVIAILLVLFALIVFLGLVQSVWWY